MLCVRDTDCSRYPHLSEGESYKLQLKLPTRTILQAGTKSPSCTITSARKIFIKEKKRCLLPRVAMTKYRKWGDSKQQQFLVSPVWRLEVGNRGVRRGLFYPIWRAAGSLWGLPAFIIPWCSPCESVSPHSLSQKTAIVLDEGPNLPSCDLIFANYICDDLTSK